MKYIGLVGYSDKKFNTTIAKALIQIAFQIIENTNEYKNETLCLVSGLTNLGIPKLGYEIATQKGWQTMGIACEKAKDYELFKVNETIIKGENWGDESETFLNKIDALIRVGGGQQSIKETQLAKNKGLTVLEYDLPLSKN